MEPQSEPQSEQTEIKRLKKERVGVVVSNRQNKTIIVRIDRKTVHPKYRKTILRSKKFHVHDEKNEAKEGDMVKIIETRPLSKLKRWRLLAIVREAISKEVTP